MSSFDRTGRRRKIQGAGRPAILAAAGLWAALSAPAAGTPPALSPEESLRHFQLEPGLRIDLIAVEPLVVDPVAFAFDEAGRLYVVENRGYPDPIEPAEVPAQGRIALLEDTDGDGDYDRRSEFATGLTYPNGIQLWRGGAFVTSAPDVLYLRDSDGDGVADERRVVLTGFSASRTAQIRASHPTLGLDGQIYLTAGLNGGEVSSPLHPDRPVVKFSPSDSRFHPDSLWFETTGGRGQFGLTLDDFGRRFICTNRHPVLQVMLEPWHLRRNPHLAFSDTVREVSRVEYEAKVYPISRSTVSADFIPKLMSAPHSGTFTSASGVLLYRGSALSPAHQGNFFVAEPAQNLVQRQVVRPDGVSFRSEPPHEGKEFLASPDVWFRPVFLGNGPDGALYLADMYRREIDHPNYVPAEARGDLDFESGKSHGRIYRIAADRPGARQPLDTATAALCRSLGARDGWERETAHRLLLERMDPGALPILRKMAGGGSSPEGRVRALWLLRSFGALSPDQLQAAAQDAHAGVRENAARLAGELLEEHPSLLDPVVALAADDSAKVRLEAALTLGSVDDARALGGLSAVAARDGRDRWVRAAVLSGVSGRLPEFFESFRAQTAASPEALALVMEDLGRLFGSAEPVEVCARFLARMIEKKSEGDLSWRIAAVHGLAEGLQGQPKQGGGVSLAELLDRKEPEGLRQFFRAALQLALDEQRAADLRVSAASLLGHADYDTFGPELGRLLDARQPPALQLAAVRALERLGDPRGGALLVQPESWQRYTPRLREAVLSSLLSERRLMDPFLSAVESGVIAPPEVSSVRRTQLLKHADPEVRQRAERIFQDLEGGDRMQVYQSYRDLLSQPAEGNRGRAVFARACSACHVYDGAGGKVGPDLTGVRNQPAEALLLHVLVPNYEVAPGYQALSVETHDGRNLSGWLAAETENAVTLRTAFGTEESVLRSNIKTLSASGVSLMPDGLEQGMTRQDLADLIAYLKGEN